MSKENNSLKDPIYIQIDKINELYNITKTNSSFIEKILNLINRLTKLYSPHPAGRPMKIQNL